VTIAVSENRPISCSAANLCSDSKKHVFRNFLKQKNSQNTTVLPEGQEIEQKPNKVKLLSALITKSPIFSSISDVVAV
jgi:hypothetical protein